MYYFAVLPNIYTMFSHRQNALSTTNAPPSPLRSRLVPTQALFWFAYCIRLNKTRFIYYLRDVA